MALQFLHRVWAQRSRAMGGKPGDGSDSKARRLASHLRSGTVANPSFTDYLLPTILDVPPMRIEVLEHADPAAPYGLKGVGEASHISTPPAIAAAVRDAVGAELRRIPIKPEHIACRLR